MSFWRRSAGRIPMIRHFFARRLWPDSLLRQILVLMVSASLFMILVGAAALFLFKRSMDANPSLMNGHFVSVAVAKLNETPSEQRSSVLEDLMRDHPQLKLAFVGEDVLEPLLTGPGANISGPFVLGNTLLGMRIEHVVGPGARGPGTSPVVYFRLKDGALIEADSGLRRPPPSVIGLPFYLFFGFLALTFFGLMFWAARALVRPLSDLEASARAFGESSTLPLPISEKGPREVRVAVQAFNRMQLRINAFVEKRTRTLAAISHDLRTPLTRLRLRLDLLDDGSVRDKSLEDLAIMETRVESALTFLRDGASSEPLQRIDVHSMLQSLANQYADTGLAIQLRCVGKITIRARSAELERALSNLIDNAHQYASGVELEAARTGEGARIDVIDRGPGIPAGQRARLLEPFERGDAAREVRAGTGFGLGLASARAIVESVSGSLDLRDTPGGGLTVRLQFP